MSETLSLASLSTVTITEGIKFLYEQAGDLLKRRRERRGYVDEGHQSVQTPTAVAEPSALPSPDMELIDVFHGEIRVLWDLLHGYAEGIEAVDVSDVGVLRQVDALRCIIETIYGTPIILVGEKREPISIRRHRSS